MRDLDKKEWAIVTSGLTKHYGGLVAVDGVSFKVARGEIFNLLVLPLYAALFFVLAIHGLERRIQKEY